MKKQIFILVFLVVATFASVSKSYGQALASTTAPRGISCVDNAMNPIAGKKYIYKAASNQAGNYTFWSTKDVDFIKTTLGVTTTNMSTTMLKSPTTPTVGTDLLTTSANYATAAATDNVEITWSDAILNGTTAAAPTFVAVNVDGTTCANNFNVWSITPIKAFTVDITNMNHTTKASLAYEAAEAQCFDIVRGAKWDATTSKMLYNYGIDTLYFEVVAANFSASFTPTFKIAGLGNGQTATIDWDIAKTFSAPIAAVAIANGTAVTTSAVTTSVTNTSAGVSIYVRVIVSNNTFEGTVATPITLSVDAQNSVNDWDIVNSTLAAPATLTCTTALAADQSDAATQTLNPRPTITPAVTVPVTTFAAGNQTN